MKDVKDQMDTAACVNQACGGSLRLTLLLLWQPFQQSRSPQNEKHNSSHAHILSQMLL